MAYSIDRNIDHLHPDLKPLVEELLVRCAFMQLWEGYRSPERQDELFLRDPPVTKARGGQSPHNIQVDGKPASCAVDMVFDPKHVILPKVEEGGKAWPALWDQSSESTRSLWLIYGKTARDLGLVWGGDWQFKDVPHVELPNWRDFR